MRISHFLARCGAGSRRACEEFVLQGRVVCNGEPVLELGRRIDPAVDRVELDGQPMQLAIDKLTLAHHKPAGVMVSRGDPQRRTTIYDLLPAEFAPRSGELVYAGRLDYNTSGLLILTTDGELVNRLTHPRHHVSKTYEVRTNRALSPAELASLRGGVDLGGGERTQPCGVVLIGTEPPQYRIVLREGKNRQVRRMVEAVGARTVSLRRVAIGSLSLAHLRLPRGQFFALDEEQIARLFQDGESNE